MAPATVATASPTKVTDDNTKKKNKADDGDAYNDVNPSLKKQKKKQKSNNDKKEEDFNSMMCSFPMARVWRLVRGESASAGDLIRPSQDTVFLINKATELFLQRFAQDAFNNAIKDRKRTITYHHLSSAVCNAKPYVFLSDFVPEKVKAEDALKLRALTET